MRKYKIRESSRIEALIEGPRGPAGTLGGFVESEKNLSHEGGCWVSGDAHVSGGVICAGEHTWCRVWADSDGYSKCLVEIDGVAWIGAGCRWFTLAEAIQHWENHTYDREETVALLQGAIALAAFKNLSHC
jgi:hypothetical protein